MELKPVVSRATKIAKNPLKQLIVTIHRSMHEKTELLDGIRKIRSCEGEILESASKTAIVCRIGVGGPKVSV